MRHNTISSLILLFFTCIAATTLYADDDMNVDNMSADSGNEQQIETEFNNIKITNISILDQNNYYILLNVTYQDADNFGDIELSAAVLSNDEQVMGFVSSFGALDAASGAATITIQLAEINENTSINTNQVYISVLQYGEEIKSEVFNLEKTWSAESVAQTPTTDTTSSTETATTTVEPQPTPTRPRPLPIPKPPLILKPAILTALTACASSIQDKIAWDYNGHKHWANTNINNLCKGAENSVEPGKCFNTAMHGNLNWGGGSKWKWNNAVDLCKGTHNANNTINCFKHQISQKVDWKKAIAACSGDKRPPVRVSCVSSVQNKIAWDYKGSKRWSATNLKQLCKGAERSLEPGKCFNTVMHGGVSWGGGTKWNWKNAVNLCQGSLNANRTVHCFKRQISRKVPWSKAINQCSTVKTSSTPTVSCAATIQGKIAWDDKGNKNWSTTNLNQLCQGAETSAEPGRCFNTVMHGNVNWGGGTQWKWENALKLCKGSKNAGRTVSCFKRQISNKVPWATAINRCATVK